MSFPSEEFFAFKPETSGVSSIGQLVPTLMALLRRGAVVEFKLDGPDDSVLKISYERTAPAITERNARMIPLKIAEKEKIGLDAVMAREVKILFDELA